MKRRAHNTNSYTMGSFFAGFFASTCIQKRYLKNGHSRGKKIREEDTFQSFIFEGTQ